MPVLCVADDTPGEFFLGPAGSGAAFGRWTFDANSDGGALGALPFPGRWRITVTPRFMTGITTWGWVRDDAVRIPLTMTEPITIEALDTAGGARPGPALGGFGEMSEVASRR